MGVTFTGKVEIGVLNNIERMTPEVFNEQKRRENKDVRLQVRVEPIIEKLMAEVNRKHFPDIDGASFHRFILYEFLRRYMADRL